MCESILSRPRNGKIRFAINRQTVPDGARIASPSQFRVETSEAELFVRELKNFVPPNSFDAHAHLYDAAHLARAHGWPAEYSSGAVTFDCYLQQQRSWMGECAPRAGLFFAFPARGLDVDAANDFVREEVRDRPASRSLLLIKPDDDAAEVKARVLHEGWAGFKVYHVFAPRDDTPNAEIGEFLPEWAWEIAHRHELAIMLHMVRARSLADESNQKTINAMCRKYSGAKLILAHAARGFCARHTVGGIGAIAGLENVYFDTSAICEAPALEAILKTFGPTRLLYGSDFPVSETRGKAVTLGDGFHWIYEWQQNEWPHGKPILIGLESLLALKQACCTMQCNDGDLEKIFGENARGLLGLESASTQGDEQALYQRAKELMPGGVQLLSKRPEMYAPEVWPPYFREAPRC
jgi:glutamate-1-semialdehyde 2,1-aminomutase